MNRPQHARSRSTSHKTTPPWIVALGGNELNAGLLAVAKRRNAKVLVVDWNERPAVTGDVHLRLDIKDEAAVLDALKPRIENLLFAYTSSDAATETAAQIHAAYGLRRPPAKALTDARHKPTMNSVWNEAGICEKRFRASGDATQIEAFHRKTRSIVKPAAGSSSRGVTIIDPDDPAVRLKAAHKRAAAIDPKGEAMIEDYVDGVEFTAEMVGDGEGNVEVLAISRKYHSPNAGRSRVANKLHYNAPDIPRALQLRIAEFARRCFRALGLHTSLGHLELIAAPDGKLVPLELGARSSGFVATHLVDAALDNGTTLLQAYEHVLRGGKVANDTPKARRSSMYFFYDFPCGVGSRSDTHLMQFTPPGVSSLASDRSNLVRGRRFAQIDADPDRYGFEILVGQPEDLTIEAVERAESAHLRAFLARST